MARSSPRGRCATCPRNSRCAARVLLVEDNEINQQVVDELLSQAGIDVAVTSGNARDRSRVPALLAELRELLEDDDTGAEEPLEQLIPLLAGSPQARLLKELADHVDSYDFDAALDVLRRLAVGF